MTNSPSPLDALVIGGANIDVFGRPLQGVLPADSMPGRVWEAAGGVGRNIAANLARLGHSTRFVGSIGDDRRGDWLMQQTGEAGVDTDGVLRHVRLPTSTYLAITDSQGEMQLAVSDMRIMDDIPVAHIDNELVAWRQGRVLVLDCNLPAAAIEAAVDKASAFGIPVFVDGVSASKVCRLEACLQGIHTLKINRLECQALTGIDTAGAGWLDQASARLLQSGVRRVVITLGSAGLRYADARQQFDQAVRAKDVGNDTGAGDALMAGLVSAWLRHYDTARQVQFGLACAAVTLDAEQANHPLLSLEKLEQWISLNA